MESGLISKVFGVLAVFCVFLIIQSSKKESATSHLNIHIENGPIPESKEHLNQFKTFYSILSQINKAQDNKNKLTLINKALLIATQDGYPNKPILRSLHVQAANIHHSHWHFLFAINSLNNAQALIFDSELEKDIKNLQTYVSNIDQERGLKTQYIATKGTGPAKRLMGKILIAYVFVDDGLLTRWSKKTQFQSQQVLQSIQLWQIEKARQYNIRELEFLNKTYIAKRNPLLKQLKANRSNSPKPKNKMVTFKSSSTEINQFVASIINSLGAKDVNDFLQKEMKIAKVEQAVLILHTNQDQRSFARRCGYTHQRKTLINGKIETELFSDCTEEYVMLMEKVKRNQWDKLHYAQAHEIMHVFGAADLYNIKNASNYAVTDIMNYQSKELQNSEVSPITAYAIGWQHNQPIAPFEILER